MKIVSQDDVRGYNDATIVGGIKGAFLAAAICIPGHMLLMKRSPYFRALPLPLKALGHVTITVPCISVAAEKGGEAYTRSQYSGMGQREIDWELQIRNEKWEKMSKLEKIGDWAARHKYGIIGGGWAASMALAFGIVARNPYQSTSQKVVQARMWAQGLTVALLVGSAMATGFDASNSSAPVESTDHSWRRMLEHDEHLTPEERAQLRDTKDSNTVKEIQKAVSQRKAAAAQA
ncbi:hypothetical protein I308_101282 [Cryptococcus tetragattii IND107]|uniref:HIG1 domain-containing protein n=1 Tax=Cryptococcus tetragattii IND107 TaxID=1296105 RepID=A0ABR3BZU5_9TREE